jgi:hypothetical protein
MSKKNVIALSQPATFTDLLSEVLRNRAQALLAKAVEAEAARPTGGPRCAQTANRAGTASRASGLVRCPNNEIRPFASGITRNSPFPSRARPLAIHNPP